MCCFEYIQFSYLSHIHSLLLNMEKYCKREINFLIKAPLNRKANEIAYFHREYREKHSSSVIEICVIQIFEQGIN